MNYNYIIDYLYQAVTDAHGENNCRLDMEFCCGLLSLLYEANHVELILGLFRKLRKESWDINAQNDTPDSILNYWCARTGESLMFTVAREVYGYDE
jgi:hypothetical protein